MKKRNEEKSLFIKEALNLAKKAGRTLRTERWSIEYDLLAAGVFLEGFTQETKDALETIEVERLKINLTEFNTILRRWARLYGNISVEELAEIIEIKKKFINLTGHPVEVKTQGAQITLEPHGSAARVSKKKTKHEHGLPAVRVTEWGEIKNLPYQMPEVTLIVSRETYLATHAKELDVLTEEFGGVSLLRWLLQYRRSIDIESIDIEKTFSNLKRSNLGNIETRCPEIGEFFWQHVPEEEKKRYLDTLKKYVGRTDLVYPGPKIRSEKGGVVACDGFLVQESPAMKILRG